MSSNKYEFDDLAVETSGRFNNYFDQFPSEERIERFVERNNDRAPVFVLHNGNLATGNLVPTQELSKDEKQFVDNVTSGLEELIGRDLPSTPVVKAPLVVGGMYLFEGFLGRGIVINDGRTKIDIDVNYSLTKKNDSSLNDSDILASTIVHEYTHALFDKTYLVDVNQLAQNKEKGFSLAVNEGFAFWLQYEATGVMDCHDLLLEEGYKERCDPARIKQMFIAFEEAAFEHGVKYVVDNVLTIVTQQKDIDPKTAKAPLRVLRAGLKAIEYTLKEELQALGEMTYSNMFVFKGESNLSGINAVETYCAKDEGNQNKYFNPDILGDIYDICAGTEFKIPTEEDFSYINYENPLSKIKK